MIKIAICDDENKFTNEYKSKIEDICQKENCNCFIETYNSGYFAIHNYNKFDVIFLDIEMPEINGIATAEQINKLKGSRDAPYIVFVTNQDNLVFDALKQLPYSFIRKTHFNEDIKNCILSLNKKIADKAVRYPVKVGRNTVFLSLNEIIYIEKDKNYVIFHTNDNEYRERSNIDEKLNDLSGKGFIRTHIGFLVNAEFVLELTNTEVILINGTRLPISKSYKHTVKDKYFEWMVK